MPSPNPAAFPSPLNLTNLLAEPTARYEFVIKGVADRTKNLKVTVDLGSATDDRSQVTLAIEVSGAADHRPRHRS